MQAAEAAIALGQAPPVAGDQYLESGPWLRGLPLVYEWCDPLLTASQRSRWAAYAERAVWNLWYHDQATRGGKPHPWPGWGIDDPGENYHHSFLEATMYWGLASDSGIWLDLLTNDKLPALAAYFATLRGRGEPRRLVARRHRDRRDDERPQPPLRPPAGGGHARAPDDAPPPRDGRGHLFARTSWSSDAVWLSLVAGPFDQSHAHQDQGDFNFFRGDFLAVTENVFSHSGIVQETEDHNLVRFVRAGTTVPQRRDTTATLAVGEAAGRIVATADLTAAYLPADGVSGWQRRIELDTTGVRIDDTLTIDGDVEPVFQVNVPVAPVVAGGLATAGDLRVLPILPLGAEIVVVDWSAVDPAEFIGGGFELEVRAPGGGATRRFVVRLQLPHVVSVDGFETGGAEAWAEATE